MLLCMHRYYLKDLGWYYPAFYRSDEIKPCVTFEEYVKYGEARKTMLESNYLELCSSECRHSELN